jgi:hypothetical protein
MLKKQTNSISIMALFFMMQGCGSLRIEPGVRGGPSRYLTIDVLACNDGNNGIACNVNVDILMKDGGIKSLGLNSGWNCTKHFLKKKLKGSLALIFSGPRYAPMALLTKHIDPTWDDITMDMPLSIEADSSSSIAQKEHPNTVIFTFSTCGEPSGVPADSIDVNLIDGKGQILNLGYSKGKPSMIIDRDTLRNGHFILFCIIPERCCVVDLWKTDLDNLESIPLSFAPMSYL